MKTKKEKSRFETFKEKLLNDAKLQDACSEQFERAENAENERDLLEVIRDNMSWCYRTAKIITIEDLNSFGTELLNASGIYITGHHELKGSDIGAALGNATVKAWGNATVEAWGNAYVLCFNDIKKHSQDEKAILKDYYSSKIYIKKGSHEIVEI